MLIATKITMDFSSYLGMTTAMLVVAITPGPAVFAVASTALRVGLRQSCYLNLGIITADYIFILLASFGVSSLSVFLREFVFEDALFLTKYLCATYLLWIGYNMFRSSLKPFKSPINKKKSAATIWLAGFAISISNPKAILFYAALLPVFVHSENLQIADVILIMLTSSVCFGSANLFYALAAAYGKHFVQSSTTSNLLNKIGGFAMVLIAVFVAIHS